MKASKQIWDIFFILANIYIAIILASSGHHLLLFVSLIAIIIWILNGNEEE